MYNQMPEQALEPKEVPNQELINDIIIECEKTQDRLTSETLEFEEVESLLQDCKFINWDTKERVLDEYKDKISHDKEELSSMKDHLEELEAF